jgi:predicted aspartyl protease
MIAETRTHSSKKESSSLVEVPFRLVGKEQPLLLVPTFVNGTGPYAFMLDTGAVQTLISVQLADSLAIEEQAIEGVEAIGVGGKVSILLSTLQSLAVGNAVLERLSVMVADLRTLSKVIGTTIEGVLGHDYLKHFRVTIDYHQKTLCLLQGGKEHARAECGLPREIHFKIASGEQPLLLLPTFVNGTGPYEFALDTATSTTAVSLELAQLLGIMAQEMAPLLATGGKTRVALSEVEALTVGTMTVHHLRVIVADFLELLSHIVGTKLDGILGHNYLSAFVVTIDYQAEVLYLQKPQVEETSRQGRL